MFKAILAVLLLSGAFGSQAVAQSAHDHGATAHQTAIPSEPGQGAFAAVGEIVATLMEDPHTNWDKVDIDALRNHLVDMDFLMTHAQVSAEDIPGGAVFHISLSGPGGDAASRMVPAHAPVLSAETGWQSEAVLTGEQIAWSVTSKSDEQAIRALGFFGLMAVGGHHQEHHLGMATGRMVH
jgi:hypothetical protein